jgi:hypothetical protein
LGRRVAAIAAILGDWDYWDLCEGERGGRILRGFFYFSFPESFFYTLSPTWILLVLLSLCSSMSSLLFVVRLLNIFLFYKDEPQFST